MMLILFLKISLEIEEIMADCKESKVQVEIQTVKTKVIPLTQLGKVFKMMNKEAEDPSSPTSTKPIQTANKPGIPKRTAIQVATKAAMEHPMNKSLSEREAKVRNQNPDMNISLVKMATIKM
ncbi:hypothetical protein WICPIJ_005584 [Wickerhamomyces pijperi]|uniref:Uncharacterized protein n=1 Tax=Wickerhamomyces pijperi TaxID=599730 RepID=A0A9P8Q5G2_WICPI|nr:hypothetical protein WICPIJ_005584 [Wickerhamomyces pijperi]